MSGVTDIRDFDSAAGVPVQTDGRIVVAGEANPMVGSDTAIVRYEPGGQLDLSFGAGGVVTRDLAGWRGSRRPVRTRTISASSASRPGSPIPLSRLRPAIGASGVGAAIELGAAECLRSKRAGAAVTTKRQLTNHPRGAGRWGKTTAFDALVWISHVRLAR